MYGLCNFNASFSMEKPNVDDPDDKPRLFSSIVEEQLFKRSRYF